MNSGQIGRKTQWAESGATSIVWQRSRLASSLDARVERFLVPAIPEGGPSMCGSVKRLLAFLCLPLLAGGTGATDKSAGPIRALLVVGGCCHDYENQKRLLTEGLARRVNIEWTIAHDPSTSTGHKNPLYDRPDWSRGFDVVVHDECTSDVNDMDVIETILEPHRNGLPAVVLHCGMHSYRTEGWNKKVATPWMQFTGLISTGHGPQEPIAVKFVDRDHAITKDLGDWTTVNEELYNNASGRLESTAHALATGTQVYPVTPGKEVTDKGVVAWTNTYNGKTRVFATTLGHNNATVNDPRYLDLVARGLLWSLGKLDAEHLKKAD
jgi:type 1 glutamine amidotransferase